MKITGFYVTKDNRVIDDRIVKQAIIRGGRVVGTLLVVSVATASMPQLTGAIKAFKGTEIVAQASSLTPHATTVVLRHSNSLASALDPIIDLLKDIAEPVSYGYAIKGALLRAKGEDEKGKKAMMDAVGGWMMVQFLPQVYDILRTITLT